jgi:hypothetical protein
MPSLTLLNLSSSFDQWELDTTVKAIAMSLPLPSSPLAIEEYAEWSGLVGRAFTLYQSYLCGQCPFLTYCNSFEDCIDYLSSFNNIHRISTVSANQTPC